MIQCGQPPSHADLLRIASHLRAAVAADDDGRVHSELCCLRNALMDHLQHERDRLPSDADVVSSLVIHGQQHLLVLVNELLVGARDMADECNCVLRAAEVDLAVRRQARLEEVLQTRSRRGATDDLATR